MAVKISAWPVFLESRALSETCCIFPSHSMCVYVYVYIMGALINFPVLRLELLSPAKTVATFWLHRGLSSGTWPFQSSRRDNTLVLH